MIEHIHVQTVLRQTVCELYSDLVTRSTGSAVRRGIEQALAERRRDATVTRMVIDFSHVGLVDHSCADEIVAKLLQRLPADCAAQCTIVFRGLSEAHLEAIEPVLEWHGLAMLVEGADGEMALVGPLPASTRRAFDAVRAGASQVTEVAHAAGLSTQDAICALDELLARRLLPPEWPGTGSA